MELRIHARVRHTHDRFLKNEVSCGRHEGNTLSDSISLEAANTSRWRNEIEFGLLCSWRQECVCACTVQVARASNLIPHAVLQQDSEKIPHGTKESVTIKPASILFVFVFAD